MRKILYIIPLFILAFTFTGGPGGWYQQTMPDIGGRIIADMTFTDSLTGYIVTANLSPGGTGFILKTTNGGDNWNIIFDTNRGFNAVAFINENTGYACGGSGGGTTYLCKTTNGGLNWEAMSSPSAANWKDLYVLNEDIIWVVDDNTINGGIFRTTNGGIIWTQQMNVGAGNPNKIYMINRDSGFAADQLRFRRTTNSGLNWTLIAGQDGFLDMHFINNSTGWKSNGNTMKKTTDGGDTWIQQTLPQGNGISESQVGEFSVLNKDTLWAVGARMKTRGLIYKTTDGGQTWGYQLPDTSINIFRYHHVSFVNKDRGWAYAFSSTGVRTITGGDDTTYYTGIQQVSNEIPQEFKLYQNYPNPFNPTTIINYELRIKGEVKLSIYDVTGKEISVLINQAQTPGSYSYIFDAYDIPSGVYFYQLKAGDYRDTKKMLMIK